MMIFEILLLLCRQTFGKTTLLITECMIRHLQQVIWGVGVGAVCGSDAYNVLVV